MTHEKFKELLEELDSNSFATLTEKNARYSSNGDALHNFKSGAEIMGGTPAQACWGYMTKHLTALRDKVERNDFSNREDLLEKCQDTINYVRFLWCIGNENFDGISEEGPHRLYRVFKTNGTLISEYLGDRCDVNIFEDVFVIIDDDDLGSRYTYSFSDFYVEETLKYGNERKTRLIKK